MLVGRKRKLKNWAWHPQEPGSSKDLKYLLLIDTFAIIANGTTKYVLSSILFFSHNSVSNKRIQLAYLRLSFCFLPRIRHRISNPGIHQWGSRNFPVPKKDGLEVDPSVKQQCPLQRFYLMVLVNESISPQWYYKGLLLPHPKCDGFYIKSQKFSVK